MSINVFNIAICILFTSCKPALEKIIENFYWNVEINL